MRSSVRSRLAPPIFQSLADPSPELPHPSYRVALHLDAKAMPGARNRGLERIPAAVLVPSVAWPRRPRPGAMPRVLCQPVTGTEAYSHSARPAVAHPDEDYQPIREP